MAPQRRLDEDEEDVDRSEEYYRKEREQFHEGQVSKRIYSDSGKKQQRMLKQQWEKY
jgi:hypothetical protein